MVVLLSLAYIDEEVTPFVEQDLIYTVIMSVLVFCFFNFRKKARCFAGDVGSVSIAFILLFLLGKLIIQTGDFSWIILLSVYGVDSVLTIFHRLMLHENIGLPHRKHLYQLMANELRIPHVVVSVIYMVLQFLIVAGLLWLPVDHWVYFFTVIGSLAVIYIICMYRYYPLHETYLKQQNIILSMKLMAEHFILMIKMSRGVRKSLVTRCMRREQSFQIFRFQARQARHFWDGVMMRTVQIMLPVQTDF